MNPSPKVSVIIPTFNYSKFISETIQNLQNQSFENIEIIVVDDGSTDDTNVIIEKLSSVDQRIRYFYQENRGLSAARNFGIEKATGKYLQFLDADDLISNQKIALQVKHLENDGSVDISFTNAFYFSDNNLNKHYRSIGLTDEEWMPTNEVENLNATSELVKRNIMPVNAAMVKAKALKAVGRFDESLKSLEDWDLWLRCALKNFTFEYLDDKNAFCLIRVHSSSMSQNRKNMLLSELSLRLKLEKLLLNELPQSPTKSRILIKENNRYLKVLLSYIINHNGILSFASIGSLTRQVGFFKLTKAYIKALNDKRKNSTF